MASALHFHLSYSFEELHACSCRLPLKQQYDLKLNQYSADMAKFLETLQTGAGKKMTMKEKLAAMNEEQAKDSMQVAFHTAPYRRFNLPSCRIRTIPASHLI